jgi:hypothetical protein
MSFKVRTMKKIKLTTAALVFSGLALSGSLQAESIPLERSNFDLSEGQSVTFKEVRGRPAMCIDRGVALLEARKLKHGTISVDVENSQHRHFANIVFRAQDAFTHESAYVRMHKGRQPDAMQYTPHINGETNWQLFGDQQSRAVFGEDDWVQLTVAFDEAQALVTLASSEGSFQLPVEQLALDDSGKLFGLRALFSACFSNLQVDTSKPDLSELSAPADKPDAGWIKQWRLSEVKKFDAFAATAKMRRSWSPAQVEGNGTLLISKYRSKKSSGSYEANQLDYVYAGVEIHSDANKTVALNFDVSDIGRVYLNGEPLMELNNSFRAKGNALFRGDFHVATQTVMLILKPGKNELVIAVAERANGWGLAAKLDSVEGLNLK